MGRFFFLGNIAGMPGGRINVTRAMLSRLRQYDRARVIELMPPFDIRSPNRGMALWLTLRSMIAGVMKWLRLRPRSSDSLYIAVNTGERQWFDLLFLSLSRLVGMDCWLHHHGYSYLLRPSASAHLLFRVAGDSSTHIVQCRKMAEDLSRRYPSARKIIPLSNAALVLGSPVPALTPKKDVRTIGFLSNLMKEKGVEDFLDLIESIGKGEEKFQFLLAGPLIDQEMEPRIRDLERRVEHFKYIGPVYGEQKEKFFSRIDVFCFPTRFSVETEGIVNLEALRAGVPVISFDRGCISEYIDDSCGFIIPKEAPFARLALEKIVQWKKNSECYTALSSGALERYVQIYRKSSKITDDIMAQMMK